MTILFEALILLLLILVNGFLAMSEISMVSARQALLRKRADDGDAGAEAALNIVKDPSSFLSSVQIGITVVGILAGVFGGAAFSRALAASLKQFDGLALYAESISLILVVVIITYLTLVFGELTPKRIGLGRADAIASRVARPLAWLARITRPLVLLLNRSSDGVLRALNVGPPSEPDVTDDEIRILLAQGRSAGVFEPIEEAIVDQVLRLSDRTVAALLTPRTEIDWIDINDAPHAIRPKIGPVGFSRYPVADGDLDRMIGVLRVRDLLGDSETITLPADLRERLHPPIFVPETLPAFELLERLRVHQAKMAFVVDEHGGVAGLVTANDIVSAIVGELPGTAPEQEPAAVRRRDGSWLVDGMMALDEFERLFANLDIQGSTEGNVQTLGGFVMAQFRRIPSAGDNFVWEGLRFEVLDMDDRRVDKVLVAPNPSEAES